MNKKSVIYQCFSGKQFKFLKSRGHEVLCSGLHLNSHHRFWVFERSNKLEKDLTEYTKSKLNDSN